MGAIRADPGAIPPLTPTTRHHTIVGGDHDTIVRVERYGAVGGVVPAGEQTLGEPACGRQQTGATATPGYG